MTICEGGVCRSVSLAFVLKARHGQDAVASSWRWNTSHTITRLSQWADYVIVMESYFADKVREHWKTAWDGGEVKDLQELENKLRIVDVGPDHYGHALNSDLVRFLEDVATGWAARQFVL